MLSYSLFSPFFIHVVSPPIITFNNWDSGKVQSQTCNSLRFQRQSRHHFISCWCDYKTRSATGTTLARQNFSTFMEFPYMQYSEDWSWTWVQRTTHLLHLQKKYQPWWKPLSGRTTTCRLLLHELINHNFHNASDKRKTANRCTTKSILIPLTTRICAAMPNVSNRVSKKGCACKLLDAHNRIWS